MDVHAHFPLPLNDMKAQKDIAMDSKARDQGTTYRIMVKGTAMRSLVDWLGDIQVVPGEHGETLLVGSFTDQAALRGLLDQLWNLNFTILSLERIENEHSE